MPDALVAGVRFADVDVGEVRLRCALAGDERAPLVLLLHGFPELWFGWRNQIAPLVAAGFFVVAPDQRGYGGSDRPRRVRAYSSDHLVGDVTGLLRSLQKERCTLVGHDWGAAVAWRVAQRHPELVEKLCVMSCPHPDVLARALVRDRRQLRRSWYVFLFQLPFLIERLASRHDYGQAVRFLKSSARRGTFTSADLEVYREAWQQPGAMKAMLDWYRAAARYDVLRPELGPVEPETLIVWGREDVALGESLVAPSLALCRRGQVAWLDDVGHFVQHEAAGRVNQLLLDFVGA